MHFGTLVDEMPVPSLRNRQAVAVLFEELCRRFIENLRGGINECARLYQKEKKPPRVNQDVNRFVGWAIASLISNLREKLRNYAVQDSKEMDEMSVLLEKESMADRKDLALLYSKHACLSLTKKPSRTRGTMRGRQGVIMYCPTRAFASCFSVVLSQGKKKQCSVRNRRRACLRNSQPRFSMLALASSQRFTTREIQDDALETEARVLTGES